MGETQEILGKITSLRQRLQQVQTLQSQTVAELAVRTANGAAHDAAFAAAVRPLAAPAEDCATLPRQLTARARRALEVGRELLVKLRGLAEAFADYDEDGGDNSTIAYDEPLARHYRETIALTDTALRLVPLFPPAASAQLRLCDGLEAILGEVSLRLRRLTVGVNRHRAEQERLDTLTMLLTELHEGRAENPAPFVALAEELLTEAIDGHPLYFASADATDVARFVAAHSLTVARVMARVARFDGDLHAAAVEPVLAALVHDVGMLGLSPELLAHDGRLNEDQRRQVEAHCHEGAAQIAGFWPTNASLANAALAHHERVDGTGYPRGLRGHNQTALTKLLAVRDVYAALASPRPHRPALETRTALTDTLLLAEQGLLDRRCAEALLHLSFYPVGTAVELADGSVGVVVATAAPGRDLRNPARPVVAVLVDDNGRALPGPRHVDLLQCEGPGVVRGLGSAERKEVLGRHHVEWL